jgi:hypothetical protein
MKANKDDIRALKNKHRLELVMRETGEVLEASTDNSEHWLSKTTPGLIVDVRRQIYEIKLPGKDEWGDVITWLKRRYSWTFGMAVKFLQKRPADPKRQDRPQSKRSKKSKAVPSIEDEIRAADRFQEKALEIGGEKIRRYFSWSEWDFVLYRVREEIRIEPTIAPQIAECQRCNKKFDWLGELERGMEQVSVQHGYKLQHVGPLPIIAYSIKRPLKTSDLGLLGHDEIKDAVNDIVEALGNAFVEDDDGIVCVECALMEIRFQLALSLCERSAGVREQALEQRRMEQARETWAEFERQRDLEEKELIGEWKKRP